MALRVLVADDHALIRDGVGRLIESVAGMEVVATAGDLPALLDAVETTSPDVVVTDIRMPPTGTTEGVEAAAMLRERHPGVGVVVLSMYAEPAYARRLLGDGTAGRAYLLKSRLRDTDELTTAIRVVADGGSVVDPQVVEAVLAAPPAGTDDELGRLTERERAVLAEMAAGRSNSAIASRLFMSSKTVEKHVSSIFAKLGIVEEATVNRRVIAVLTWLDAAS